MNATFSQYDRDSLKDRLAHGLGLKLGPFTVAIKSNDSQLAGHLKTCYPDYPLAAPDEFKHCAVSVEWRGSLIPGRSRGMVYLDDGAWFTDYAAGEALPYLEWAINWCVATRCHFYLMLHAAVVEKNSKALIMPGLPGAGKSTLCTYLVHNGWRQLSDVFCLIRPGGTEIVPFPRLIPLKNEAIDVIGKRVADARIGPRFEGTRKGTVAHVSPLDEHARASATATAALIIEPVFSPDAGTELTSMSKPECFVELSKNAFNYQILGRAAFETVAEIVDRAPAHRLRYCELDAASDVIESLADQYLQ